MDYDKLLQRFTGRLEQIVFRITLFFVVVVFIAQAVLLNYNLGPYLNSGEGFEGMGLLGELQQVIGGRLERDEASAAMEQAVLIELITPPGEPAPRLTLLVNGKAYSSIDEAELYVPVSPGDLLEVEGYVYGSQPAVVRIAEVYGELQKPQKGWEITTFGDRELISWILP